MIWCAPLEVRRQWQRDWIKKRGDFTKFLGKPGFYLKLSGAWDLLLQSLAAGLLSSAASPSPGCIPFDQAWGSVECGFHLLAPLSLSWFGGCLRSQTATTRGNEGSFVDWHLIWPGSVQWSLQISPGPDWVCVSARLLLHNLRQLTKRSGLCGRTSKLSDGGWRCFFCCVFVGGVCSIC